MHLVKCSPGSSYSSSSRQGLGWEMNDASGLQIRWTEGYLMPQEPTEIVVYSHGEDNGDDDEIAEMDNNVDLIFEA